MKSFKQIELFIGSAMILVFLLAGIITGKMNLLFTAYFTVGVIHVVGMLVHAYNHWFTGKGSPRLYYHWLVVILLSLILVNGVGLLILLYTAPLLALIYTFICWRELRALQLKEFVHLK
nr:hypothetical protein [uncultured Lacibacter sp.]